MLLQASVLFRRAPISIITLLPPNSQLLNRSLMANSSFTSTSDLSRFSTPSKIFKSAMKLVAYEQNTSRSLNQPKRGNVNNLRLKSFKESPVMFQKVSPTTKTNTVQTNKESDIFNEMKQSFLNFKKDKFLQNPEIYSKLAKAQEPKFMVIACGDSRVCPSNILGFQPGDAFIIRNVANLVPPFENGPTETNAALEFAVNALEVENILVIGHSCCGGIRALMDMHDEEEPRGFTKNWVVLGKDAKIRTKAATSSLDFDEQCQHCERESVNRSLLNLLTYSWIEENLVRGKLSIHGGYYDFVNCSFEKWTLDYQGSHFREAKGKCSFKNHELWS